MLTVLAFSAIAAPLTVDTPRGPEPATTPVALLVATISVLDEHIANQAAFDAWDARRVEQIAKARHHRKRAVTLGVLGGAAMIVGGTFAGIALNDSEALCVNPDSTYGLGGCDGSITTIMGVLGGAGFAGGVALEGLTVFYGVRSHRANQEIGPRPANPLLTPFEPAPSNSVMNTAAPDPAQQVLANARWTVHRAKTHPDRDTQVEAWNEALVACKTSDGPEVEEVYVPFIVEVLHTGAFSRRQAANAYGEVGMDLQPLIPLLRHTKALTQTAVKRAMMRVGRRTNQLSEAENAIEAAGLLVPPR